MQNVVKSERLQMLIIAMATAISAQFKINPFSHDFFRIGLGVSIFLFFLLLMPHLPYVKTGILTGIASMIVQSGDWITHVHSFTLMESLRNNVAAGCYYVVFAIGMSKVQGRTNELQPLILGGYIAVIDFFSNETELLLRGVFIGTNAFYLKEWFLILGIAVVRSYFVIGLYNSIAINQMRSLHAEQEKRMEQMLNINSGLYGEVFYLKKAMDTIEGITADSYDLYRNLKRDQLDSYGLRTLRIAQQIHEVKKDSQRILAGLLKLFDSEVAVNMSLSEILHFVVKGNQEYSEMLKKKIRIETELTVHLETSEYVPLLTIMNNLVANAVEAIEKYGTIGIQMFEKDDDMYLIITDSGKGIPDTKKELIFEPGYTTKYNEEGIAATGIGLSHVRDIVHSMGGTITIAVSEQAKETQFIVRLPQTILIKEGRVDGTFDHNRR
ncbi:ATP-binding protein [Paenibacillus sp. HWE-109]|uniref:ATP-binding protein n=1 Tax=Paenibacillus sp. HWE-109 TaxID=1306526 RepID=UPI001EDCB72F|nr:ATP-binding protein [Paenibacillus sp. HWE-109]UKS24302.1 ATP-binding protein [Paenibacillus sp. HWE-109]